MTQNIEMPPHLNAAYEGDDLFTGDQLRQAVLAEREACAKVCYELPWKDMTQIPSNLAFAAAIRARGEV